ncbi:LuxR C-terminal-related transcriptional regulator [Neptunicella marina]|uniref:HTH luxR-type domain-containing protein n=1 Tax=Neptunicella marina TaxID=2125989 RepID=A0A8J6ISP2_9ALTE|nr:LuxR C-terminal-related transcriptional regulator [Neptunicella marina]MBC3765584.1 hypothetical protein [Neptunicella marina]
MTDKNRINSTDFILELIEETYSASRTGQWQGLLDKLLQVTASNKAFFYLTELASETPAILEYSTTINVPAKLIQDYQARPFEDPYYSVSKDMSEGDVLVLNHYLDLTEYQHTDFYQNVIVPMDSAQVITSCLCRDGKHEAMLALNRGFNDPDYTVDEINLLKKLAPHLSRAMHIFKEINLLKQYSALTKHVIDQSTQAVIVTDEHGKIILSNDFANKHLTQGMPVSIQANHLLIDTPVYQQMLLNNIQQCAHQQFSSIGEQQTLIVTNDNYQEARIRVSPLQRENGIVEISTPCALVTIKLQHTIDWVQFNNEYNLTPKELELLQALNNKQTLKDIATSKEVAYNTLRVHLQNIYRKMNINSQIELMATLAAFSQ